MTEQSNKHFIVKRTVLGTFGILVSKKEYTFSTKEKAEFFVNYCKEKHDPEYIFESIFPRTISYEFIVR